MARASVFSNFSSNFSAARAGAATKATTKAAPIRTTGHFRSCFFIMTILLLVPLQYLFPARGVPVPCLQVQGGIEQRDFLGVSGQQIIPGFEGGRLFEHGPAGGLDGGAADRHG